MQNVIIKDEYALPLATTARPRRIWELDFLRGICVLLMIWDHLMYNFAYVFGETWVLADIANSGIYDFAVEYWFGALRTFFHPIIFCIFFVICGISCSFSRNNLQRGLQALMFSLGITIVTALFGATIRFGVLHMLAFAILFWWLIDTVCRHNIN